MKKLVRTPEMKVEKIRNSGLLAGLAGRSSEQCPWEQMSKKAAWMEGWREGREGYQNGTCWLH